MNSTSINGLNLYVYCDNDPINLEYLNISDLFFKTYNQSSNLKTNDSRITLNVFDPNFLRNYFSHVESIFSATAGIIEVIRKSKGLEQLESLSKISKSLMHIGYWLNIGLSIYNHYYDDSLTKQEKWVSFTVDTIHTTGQTVGSYFLACIPYAGPFLAIGVPIIVDYIWLGELCIFGFDINVESWKPFGKTPEGWVKYWINSWFE